MKVEAGAPVPAADFVRAGEAPSRAARRLTQWLLTYYGSSATEHALPADEKVKSPSGDAVPGAPVLN